MVTDSRGTPFDMAIGSYVLIASHFTPLPLAVSWSTCSLTRVLDYGSLISLKTPDDLRVGLLSAIGTVFVVGAVGTVFVVGAVESYAE